MAEVTAFHWNCGDRHESNICTDVSTQVLRMDLVEVLNFLFQLGSSELGEVYCDAMRTRQIPNFDSQIIELLGRDVNTDAAADAGRFTRLRHRISAQGT